MSPEKSMRTIQLYRVITDIENVIVKLDTLSYYSFFDVAIDLRKVKAGLELMKVDNDNE